MDQHHHARISRLFSAVCDLPPEEQRQRLAEENDPALAAEVEALLRAETKPILRTPALGEGFSLTGSAGGQETDAPRRIGPYTVRRCLSAGGMAIVYEAEQDRPHRIVALKVLRGGLMSRSALKRFHLEAEVLGRLEHPGIARIYDAGIHRDPAEPAGSPGLPYFAMELIEGAPITDFASARALSIRGRMDLLARVCDAVQHAHQHGIIHRDLKPANILVDAAGQPRVLDFGVARATGSEMQATTLHTEAGQLVGTIPYMSPEQVAGDPAAVDTRSDVYALGIVLYELLCGRLPYAVREAAIPEAARIIRDQDAVPLASVDRALRGDPSTIVARALEKDPARRYQSAAEFAADIRRFLADEPIVARPASTIYQLGKLARRHRGATAALAALLLTLLAATAISLWMAGEARRARNRAEAALSESAGTSVYLLDLFLESPDKPTIDRVELLERAERRLRENAPSDPRVEAKVREYIGHGWQKLNYLENAEPHLSRALEIRRALGVRDLDMAECLLLTAMQRFTQGRIDEGRAALTEMLAIRRSLLGPSHLKGGEEDEALYFIVTYAPEEPEALAEIQRRRLLREQPPVPAAAGADWPVVVEDGFDGAAVDPAWSATLLNCSAWTGAVEDSRLVVKDLQATELPGDADGSLPSRLRLSRLIDPPLGDFRIEARIGWDSEEQRESLQYLSVIALGPARLFISSVQYGDDWMQFGGARKAGVGRAGPDNHSANTGRDTLPAQGAADVVIERRAERITVTWDGRELLRGASTDPMSEIAIDFLWTVSSGEDRRSSFGSEWIDHIRVTGTPAR